MNERGASRGWTDEHAYALDALSDQPGTEEYVATVREGVAALQRSSRAVASEIAEALREERDETWHGGERRPNGFARAAEFIEFKFCPTGEGSP